MKITGNEVAVDNQMRRAEKQNQSPVNRLLENAETAAGAISISTGSVVIGSIAKALGIARKFTSGLGVATLEENLNHLGDATEASLSRVEKNLEAHGVRVDEIERRLNSNELLEGIKAATLQAQRTKDKKRLDRMALILANGLAENDLEPDSLDDMMRAAVELREQDIQLLQRIFESQRELLKSYRALGSEWGQQVGIGWLDRFGFLDTEEGRNSRSALARLQSLGFIQEVHTNISSTGELRTQPFGLLPEGKKFYERLQEIAAK